MADDTLADALLHLDEFLALALEHLGHGNAGPRGDHLGDVLVGDFLLQQALGLSGLLQRLLHVGQFFLEARDGFVADLRRLVEVAVSLGFFLFAVRLLELAVDDAGGVDRGFFVLPTRFQLVGFLLQVGQGFLQLGQALPAGGVFLFFQRRALDLELHDLALELVDLGRHRVEFHPQPRRRLVDEVDRLVRQKPVGDVAVGQGCGGDECGVLNTNAVVHLVAFLESAQDGDGVLDGWLVHFHRLEAALEGGVFFDMFAVLVERGRADAAKFAAGELRLEHVGGIGCALGGAGADERVQFVDEQNNLTVAGGDFLDERLEAILEFASILRAGNHRAEIHRDQRLVVE